MMRRYDTPDLGVEEEVTFLGIPDEAFDDVMTALDDVLCHQMRKNEIQESKSIEFASKFVTTL